MWHIYFHNETFRIQQSLCQGWLLDEATKSPFTPQMSQKILLYENFFIDKSHVLQHNAPSDRTG